MHHSRPSRLGSGLNGRRSASGSPRPIRAGLLTANAVEMAGLGIKDRAIQQLVTDDSPALNFLARRGSEAASLEDEIWKENGNKGEDIKQLTAEAMANAERELAEDAEWKRIQLNTFTRWTNEHLRQAGAYIDSLETDFADGLKLIALVEVLSGKKLPRYNRNPQFKSQQLENISIALHFLEMEGIHLVNIDSSDIIDCKLKLILGLIWTLILHYAISMPMWNGPPMGGGTDERTPKQRLMDWMKDKLPMLPLTNFTDDWMDGKALGALVDAVAPGLCPNWQHWDPKQPLKNAEEAMDLAQDWLNVAKLLTPKEIINPNIDEQSIMTYLSQYPRAKVKAGAPLRSKIDENKVKAYGPGVDTSDFPLVAKAPAKFTVETFGAGDGDLDIKVATPNGIILPCDKTFNNDRKLSYACTYVPETEDDLTVNITYSGNHIPKSPFKVNVKGYAGDASKVTARGPGLELDGVFVNKPTWFEIFTDGAGKGHPEVIIIDPYGKKESIICKISPPDINNVYKCDYVAPHIGPHIVKVLFAGSPINDSPFNVNVSPACRPGKVWATGRGLQPKGIRVLEKVDFQVHTENAGDGNVGVQIVGPGARTISPTSRTKGRDTTEYTYTPLKEGRHIILITFGGKEIPQSPFEVNIGPKASTNIKAFGPGLKEGLVDIPARFTVDTCGETGALNFSIEGPSQAKISCHDNGDGSANVEYLPTKEGEYAVHILCNDEDIPGSPYMALISPKTDSNPQNVRCYGPGLNKTIASNETTHFTIDTTDAGTTTTPLEVLIVDDTGERKPKLKQTSDGIYDCLYTPKDGQAKQTIMVNYGGVAVPNSPWRVENEAPYDLKKTKVYGPGVEYNGVQEGKLTYFIVDFNGRHPTPETEVKIVGIKGNFIEPTVMPCKEGLRVEYKPHTSGIFSISIYVDNGTRQLPQCPIKINVKPKIDVNKISVSGFEPEVFVDCPNNFDIHVPKSTDAGKCDKLSCDITGPGGQKLEPVIEKEDVSDPISLKVNFNPNLVGGHRADISYSGVPIPGSPFTFKAKRGHDARRVSASGPGLERGLVGRPNEFLVDTKKAGSAPLSVDIEGPSEAAIVCHNNNDGTCSIQYEPNEEGNYDVNVKFGDEHISQSPFRVPVTYPEDDRANKVDPSKVTAYGPGLEPGNVFPGKPVKFFVDAHGSSEKAPIQVSIEKKNGQPLEGSKRPLIEYDGDGVHKVTYVPPPVGQPYQIRVKYDDQDIPMSPFAMSSDANINEIVKNGPTDFDSLMARGHVFQKKNRPNLQENHGSIKPSESRIIDETDRSGIIRDSRNGPSKANPSRNGSTEDFHQIKLNNVTVPSTEAPVVAQVITPSGYVEVPHVDNNGNGSVDILYQPHEKGNHTLNVRQNKNEVDGSPFKFYANTVDSVGATGSGLIHGICGLPAEFTVSNLGTNRGGDLALAVEGPSKADITCKNNGDGTVNLSFMPTAPGEYNISANFGEEAIPGSPFTCKVTGKAKKRNHISVGTSSDLTLPEDLSDYNLRSLNANILTPSGIEEPCFLKKMAKSGKPGISFTPRELGEHQVSVLRDGKHIANSPFKIHVSQDDIGDANRVKIYSKDGSGSPLSQGFTHTDNHFTVDTKNAGYGGLSLSVEGPSKAEIKYDDHGDGILDVSYRPTEPGSYVVNMKFADKHIPGSPFTVPVTGEGSIKKKEGFELLQEAMPINEIGSQSQITFKLPNINRNDLQATVEAPSRRVRKASITKTAGTNDTYAVSFVPQESGTHTIRITNRGIELPGTPLEFTVGPLKDSGAHKVHAGGPGLESGTQGIAAEFDVWTREAGEGNLAIAIEGPSKAEMVFDDRKDGSCHVNYVVDEPGNYTVGIRFNNTHIPKSPFNVYIQPHVKDTAARQVHMSNVPNEETLVQTGVPQNMLVNMNGVEGDFECRITTPSGRVDDCFVTPLGNGEHSIRYVSKEEGTHQLHATLDGINIPGSPFKFNVEGTCEASTVTVSGKNINSGFTGDSSIFTIDTSKVGVGTLTVTVDGPSKVDLKCNEVESGYDVNFIPYVPGKYYVTIKYNGRNVSGSPFAIDVNGDNLGSTSSTLVAAKPRIHHSLQRESSRSFMSMETMQRTSYTRYDNVRKGTVNKRGVCSGPGIERAYVGRRNSFDVDCADMVGDEVIYVGLQCPDNEGGQQVVIKHLGNKQYSVHYTVTKGGRYLIYVKWGDTNVEGSPFVVNA